jgi:hypothetical protein
MPGSTAAVHGRHHGMINLRRNCPLRLAAPPPASCFADELCVVFGCDLCADVEAHRGLLFCRVSAAEFVTLIGPSASSSSLQSYRRPPTFFGRARAPRLALQG